MQYSAAVILALLPALALAQFNGCSISVDGSVPTLAADRQSLMDNSTIFPLSLFVGKSTDTGVYSCYTMASDFSITYYDEDVSSYLTTATPTVLYTESNTVKLRYADIPSNVMANQGFGQNMQMSLYLVQSGEFLIFEACFPAFFSSSEGYSLWAYTTLDTSTFDARCVVRALDSRYSITDVIPLGICSV